MAPIELSNQIHGSYLIYKNTETRFCKLGNAKLCLHKGRAYKVNPLIFGELEIVTALSLNTDEVESSCLDARNCNISHNT